jgi:hypothetical protein
MRSATGKISQADIESWGMSEMGNMSKSTKKSKIPMTSYDSGLGSVARSSLVISMRG